MQFEFRFVPSRLTSPDECWVRVGVGQVRLHFVRHRRARRYVLRLKPDGSARVTLPHSGSLAEAKRFVHRNIAWLEGQLLRQEATAQQPQAWQAATEILFRGDPVRLEKCGEEIRFATETVLIKASELDLRPAIERHLWRLAARELPLRVLELAVLHQFQVKRVTVRNQRSRWGSCSRHGTISLNWRLIQAPQFVCDYIMLHELAHLREMNHSRRFWSVVGRLCPNVAEAEKWLKENSGLLR